MTDKLINKLAALILDHVDPDDIPADEWKGIVDIAWREGVAPLLGYQLQHHVANNIDPKAYHILSLGTMKTARHHFLMREMLGKITVAFSEANIPVLWLKGLALAYIAYPQPTLRRMSDHDIWVPTEHIHRAYDLLLEIGFEYQRTSSDRIILIDPRMAIYWSHHYVFSSKDGIIVELHNHILLEPAIFLKEYERWFWEQQQSITIKDNIIQTLSPVATLLHLCGHMTIHHSMKRLINYLDIHYVVSTGGVDWDQFVEMCRKLDWSWFVLPALEKTIEYFGTAIPMQVLDDLRQVPIPTEMVKQLEAIHQPRTLLSQVWSDMRKIPRSKLPIIFLQIIAPPMSVLKERNHNRRMHMLFQYPYHWLHLIREIQQMSRTPHQPH